jgi:LmbE family N-acetylglucosaminyl deacetylase
LVNGFMVLSMMLPAVSGAEPGKKAAAALAVPAAAVGPTSPAARSAGEILAAIERLSVVGSVLYVAAHPDDENTRLLAWLVGHLGLQATYLSMTRGGGGQNLIGTEQAELLDVVRTGELLAARSIDGATQRFSRMRDFGYSKSPVETLRLWGHDEARADVVHTIRSVRPDVIITRFLPHGVNHGHHTASAILAGEAFGLAADAKAPGSPLPPWQAHRLLHNQSHWRITEKTDTSKWMQLDVGDFDPRIGQSFGEVAARSRSQHKSQGFGAAPAVGPQLEYFEWVDGSKVGPGDDPFKGLDFTWGRFAGTEKLREALAKTVADFDARAPHRSLPQLAQIHTLMTQVPDAHWRDLKVAELEAVMADCAGLWLTVRADRPAVAPGEVLKLKVSALNRSPAKVDLVQAGLAGGAQWMAPRALSPNQPAEAETTFTVPTTQALTVPHWLEKPASANRFTLGEGHLLRDAPDTPPALAARFEVAVDGVRFGFTRAVEWAETDAVLGERRHAVEVLPAVTATLEQTSMTVVPGEAAHGRLVLRAPAVDKAVREGQVRLVVPAPFSVEPATVDFRLDAAQPERVVEFKVRSSAPAGSAQLSVEVSSGTLAPVAAWSEARIDYAHLPQRTVLRPTVVPVHAVDLKRGAVQKIAYLPGSGDGVAEALRGVGYTVDLVDEAMILGGGLSGYDALVVGIRAYNTRPRLMAMHGQLMAWVEGGGRMLVQYNTNNRFNPLKGLIGPYPFEITSDRVTDETAAMQPVDALHAALTTPNALSHADFEGWVQERGLYFPGDIDPRYQSVFSMHDPDESPSRGSVLVARHGKGTFVYTGLSFFRQLPAGVPGAFRLFANLLAQ